MTESQESQSPDPGVDVKSAEEQLNEQVREQLGQKKVRIRMDDKEMVRRYANTFRTNVSADEVILDFGVNMLSPMPPSQDKDAALAEVVFNIEQRVMMNYYTAKRLALTLSELIRRYEDRFGELKLNVAERAKSE